MIRWPGVTKAGSVINDPVSSIDFLPWICRLAGAFHGAVDGVDFSPLLRGEHVRERPLFWHYPHYSDQGGKPSGAVRLGDWKLIDFFEDGRLELFHLPDDLGEQRNLVRREPQRARQLLKLLKDWRETVRAVMPTPNPGFDPERCSEHLTGYEAATPPV
jgi:arylsulfatase A-like enzyme